MVRIDHHQFQYESAIRFRSHRTVKLYNVAEFLAEFPASLLSPTQKFMSDSAAVRRAYSLYEPKL